MRIYIDGVLSTKQDTFLPTTLWFATEDCDDNTCISYQCMCLDGISCESSMRDNKFTCRWKGVEIHYIDNDGEEVETEDFTVSEFMDFIKAKNMRLVNMDAYFDIDVDVKITKLTLVDYIDEVEFDLNLIDEIEFIA